MRIRDLRPGDILAYRPKRKAGLIPKLIAVLQWFLGEGWGLYSHVSIVSFDTIYEFESTFPVSKKTKIGKCFDKFSIDVYRVKCPYDAKLQAISWCIKHLGIPYDIFRIISFGKLAIKKFYVCSTFVGEAYRSAGVVFDEKAGVTLSPNEICDSELVDFVGELEK